MPQVCAGHEKHDIKQGHPWNQGESKREIWKSIYDILRGGLMMTDGRLKYWRGRGTGFSTEYGEADGERSFVVSLRQQLRNLGLCEMAIVFALSAVFPALFATPLGVLLHSLLRLDMEVLVPTLVTLWAVSLLSLWIGFVMAGRRNGPLNTNDRDLRNLQMLAGGLFVIHWVLAPENEKPWWVSACVFMEYLIAVFQFLYFTFAGNPGRGPNFCLTRNLSS